MNLTKFIVAGLCATALTASAGFIKTNAFEGEPSTGWWVGDEDTLTTRSVPNDAENGRASYGGVRPMPDAANANVLKLDTEGGVWTNEVDRLFTDVAPVYADMLVKFVPSEELPAIGLEVKMAVAVKQDVDTKFYLNIASLQGSINDWTQTTQEISTNDWYRLTIKLFTDNDNIGYSMVVFVNGVKISGGTMAEGGFKVNDALGTEKLNSIGFQGTGFIDEVVVRDDDPISTAVLLTLSFVSGTDIASVLVDGNPKNSGDTVASGSDLVITAAQWKEIASVTGPSTVTYVAGAAGSSVATVTVANASATTVTIAAQTETSTTGTSGTGTSFDGAPMDKVATWALANGVTTLSSGIYDNYLLNIDDAATVPDLLITSISVSGSTVTVTVAATGVNFATINGTLKIKAYPTLGGAETVYTANVTGYSPVTIVQDIGSNKFVKAAVE